MDKNVQLLPSASFLLTRASESSQGKVKEPQSLNRDGKRKVGITPRARANVDSSPKAGRRILSEAGERVSTRNSLRWGGWGGVCMLNGDKSGQPPLVSHGPEEECIAYVILAANPGYSCMKLCVYS